MQQVRVSDVRKAISGIKFDPRETKMKALIEVANPEWFEISAMEKLQEARVAGDLASKIWSLTKAIHFLILAIIGYGRTEKQAQK